MSKERGRKRTQVCNSNDKDIYAGGSHGRLPGGGVPGLEPVRLSAKYKQCQLHLLPLSQCCPSEQRRTSQKDLEGGLGTPPDTGRWEGRRGRAEKENEICPTSSLPTQQRHWCFRTVPKRSGDCPIDTHDN